MPEQFNSEIINEVERILEESREDTFSRGEGSGGRESVDRSLSPQELYDWVIKLLPLSEKAIKPKPVYIAGSMDAAVKGNGVVYFPSNNTLYRIHDNWVNNYVSIARFDTDGMGKPVGLIEQATISGGIEGTEDPEIPPQYIEYKRANATPLRNSLKAAEEIEGFLNRIDYSL